MRTSRPLAYKSVRTLSPGGVDYASPAPLRLIHFMEATVAGAAPFLPRVSRHRRSSHAENHWPIMSGGIKIIRKKRPRLKMLYNVPMSRIE